MTLTLKDIMVRRNEVMDEIQQLTRNYNCPAPETRSEELRKKHKELMRLNNAYHLQKSEISDEYVTTSVVDTKSISR